MRGEGTDREERIAALEAELARVKASEKLHRSAAQLSGRMIWAADAAGAVTVAGAPFAKVTGRADAQALGEGWLKVVHPDDRAAVAAAWRAAVNAAAPFEAEFRAQCVDGSYRTMRSRAVPLRDQAGVLSGWAGAVEDVDEERRVERAGRDAEQRLRESEELHRYTIELSRQVVFSATNDGRIFSISPRFWELTGLAPGTRPREGVPPRERRALMAQWRQSLASGAPLDTETVMRMAGGALHRVRVRAAPRRDEAGEILRWYGTIEDVQERHEGAEKLRESEEMHRLTLELMRQIAWTAEPDGTGLALSARYRELTGMGNEEDPELSIHPEDRPLVAERWGASVATGKPFLVECRLRMKSGGYRAFRVRAVCRRDETGKILRWYGISEDIEEEKAAELVRRDLEERYRLVAQATNDAIWDHDLAQDTIDWSDNAAATLGATPPRSGRTSGSWWADRIHPDEKASLLKSLADAIRGDARRWSGTYRFRRDDGSYADMLDRGFIIRDADGRAVRAVGAMSDVSERHRAEAEIRRMQAELIHVSRLSAMGAMASTLAHELNQPLTAVSNFVSGAKRLSAQSEAHEPLLAAALDDAETAARRAGEILRRLRDLVSRGKVAVRDEHLPTLIAEACVLAFIDAEPLGIVHRLELDPAAAWVRADRVQVQQVLINLVRNAVEAIGDGAAREVVVASRAEGNRIEIAVRDSGAGIAAANPDDLFSEFLTTKSSGMGLGLPISRTIVEAHGGRIWGENRPEGGAAFRFTLPASRRRRAPARL